MRMRRWGLIGVSAAILALLMVGSAFAGGRQGDPPGLARAISAQEAHTDALLAKAGVVGTAVTLGPGGRAVVAVLAESGDVPGIPRSLDGVPVVVAVTGEIHALAPPPLDASFSASCSGLSCTFDGSGSTGRKLSFDWNFGDDKTGTGKVVNHTYAAANTNPGYSVTLTVTDKDSKTDTATQTVEVTDGAPPPPPPPPPPPGGNDCFLTGDTKVKCDWPVPIGVSGGHPDITAGTAGARVTDGNNLFILTNNHVAAATNAGRIGDPFLQPGTFDGGVAGDSIGTLSAFKEILFDGSNNVVDAAIVSTTEGRFKNSTPISSYGTPSSTHVTSVGFRDKVLKFGRTTLETECRVWATNATVNVNYGDVDGDGNNDVARFVRQIVFRGGDCSAGGDSGSLFVTKDGLNPMGLLFAGSSNTTIANPIGDVLAAFGVTVDGTVDGG